MAETEYIWVQHQFAGGPVYRGSFLGTKKEGRGYWRHPNGDTYEGGYHDNKQHGWGVYTFGRTAASYSGEWFAGEKHGRGLYRFDSQESEIYIGRYEHDAKHGKGLYYYPDGRIMLQEWDAGKLLSESEADVLQQFEYFCERLAIIAECEKHARNQIMSDNDIDEAAVQKQFNIKLETKDYTFPSRATYCGEFLGAKKHGRGLWRHPEGDTYDGQFRYNKHSGWGVYVVGKSGKRFIGAWALGKMHGWGVYCFNAEDTEYFVGTYVNDLKHGRGLYYFASGHTRYQTWTQGQLQQETDGDEETHRLYDSIRRAVLKRVQEHAVHFSPTDEQMSVRGFPIPADCAA